MPVPGPTGIKIRPARAKTFLPNVILGPPNVILGPPNVILGPPNVILGLDPRIGQPRHLLRCLNSLARREILGPSPRMTIHNPNDDATGASRPRVN
jgi:hypothetical protein